MPALPNFFRDQLPDPIRSISDAATTEETCGWIDDYSYRVEYSYRIIGRDGRSFHTSLGVIQGYEPMSFEVGQEICLHGVWVEVVSVETTTETHEEDGRLLTFYDVEIREKETP